MDLITAVVLGLLQGIAEWLPISSQGQVMAFALAFLNMTAEQGLKIAVFLHAGTLIAAAFYYRGEIKKMISGKENEKTKFIGIAFLSTAITAVPLYLVLKTIITEFNPALVLLLIGILLIITGIIQSRKKSTGKSRLSNKNAVLLGLGQGFSVLPGISRSGITSSVLLFRGFKPEEAFHLSFLLSIPSVFAAELAFGVFDGFEFGIEAIVALAVAAVIGYASIAALIKIAKKINFSKFCIAFGVLYALMAVGYFL